MAEKTKLASMIEAAALGPKVTAEDVKKLCKLCVENNIFGIAIDPTWISLAKEIVGDKVKVVAVIGFPHGTQTAEAKAFEANQAVQLGADELDMVMNIGKFKSGNYDYVKKDIEGVVAAGKPVKVILETGYLDKEEIVKACKLCEEAGAKFVKTSTGFGPKGAEVEDVKIMHEAVPNLGIKASGGIRTKEQALELIKAGANRIGASKPLLLLEGLS